MGEALKVNSSLRELDLALVTTSNATPLYKKIECVYLCIVEVKKIV